MTTVHEAAIRTAANRWYDAEAESAKLGTGIAAVASIAKAVAPLVLSMYAYASILDAAAALLSMYAYGGDDEGLATQGLVKALTTAGFPPPEPIVPLTDEERGEVWNMWDETVFRGDPSTGLDILFAEWTDRDWREEHDDIMSMGSE